jgi:hypothetical protein
VKWNSEYQRVNSACSSTEVTNGAYYKWRKSRDPGPGAYHRPVLLLHVAAVVLLPDRDRVKVI